MSDTAARLAAAGLKVKPLEWKHLEETLTFYASWNNDYCRIEDRSQHGKGFVIRYAPTGVDATERSLEAAKAAAQADYEARILAALTGDSHE